MATDLLVMCERGDTLSKISGVFGLSSAQVARELEKLGMKRRRRRRCKQWTPEEDALLTALRKDGVFYDAVAKLLGCESSQCRTRARRLELIPPRILEQTDADGGAPTKRPRARDCLRCGRSFLSTWAGNRMCAKCAVHNKRIFEGADTARYRVARGR